MTIASLQRGCLAEGFCQAAADVRRRISPLFRQSVAQISAELGIYVVTLYNWRKAWRLQGEAVPAPEKEPEGWNTADKFIVVLENVGLNIIESASSSGSGVSSPSWLSVGASPP
ncbi:MAG: helix-turn-helix domain-containing protein [Cyanobium sp. LacPavin_0920_WC12_MAG_62_9]|nr:helix-turn-helix domain-containing protein [Cyanobium sp. LacPavin_0920_WC12_MAG_62_9]